jgi:7-carboxy-7-deazaguanine synthase
MMPEKIPLVELYGPVIQGEGAICGQVSYFLRTGGCSFRCSWCDSMHAVDPKQIRKGARYLTPSELVEETTKLIEDSREGSWMTLTGGDPLMWDLGRVAALCKLHGLRVLVETQAVLNPLWLQYVDIITCSPKPPSSGMADKNDPFIIRDLRDRYGLRVKLKIVVFGKEDLQWATDMHKAFPEIPFYMSVGTPQQSDVHTLPRLQDAILKRYKWLTEQVIATPDLHDAIISPQMHTLIYGHAIGV